MSKKVFRGSLEIKAGDEGLFSATFATLNVIDRDGDVTLAGAFMDGQAVKIAAWGHNWGGLTVGKGVIHADAERAWVDGQFNLATAAGREHYETVKFNGPDQEWSYGFDILEHSFGQFEERDVRFLRKMDVFEVSPVLLGAGINTRTDWVKGHGLSFGDHSEGVRVAVAEWVERVKSGTETRRKEGRAISAARRTRMASVSESLRTSADEIDAMLKETEPSPKAADQTGAQAQRVAVLRLRHDYARLRARLDRDLGVTTGVPA